MNKPPKRASHRRIGLARTLSKQGYCSRAQAFTLVREGRVAVNGQIQSNPEFPVRANNAITVDGQPVTAPERLYLMMNKPRGLITTASDEKNRPTVYSLLDSGLPWVAPVGRLDQGSEGLLLFTNDSEWAARITAPQSHVEKTYRVQIAAIANDTLLARLCAGVLDAAEHLCASRASIVRTGRKNSWVELVLEEGKNRQIRRMFAAEGIDVLRLVRIAIGPLALGTLPKGAVRPLTASEKQALDASVH